MGFSKKLNLLFLVDLYHFTDHYEDREDKVPIWSGKWDARA